MTQGKFEQLASNKLLKAKEVADLLNISNSLAYRLMQTGEINSVRIGSACRVRPIDLNQYIESNIHTSNT